MESLVGRNRPRPQVASEVMDRRLHHDVVRGQSEPPAKPCGTRQVSCIVSRRHRKGRLQGRWARVNAGAVLDGDRSAVREHTALAGDVLPWKERKFAGVLACVLYVPWALYIGRKTCALALGGRARR